MKGKIQKKTLYILFFYQAVFVVGLWAQEEFEPIPRSYRKIELGMTTGEVKNLLASDSWFDYRGDPSVSLLKRPRASLIDAGGSLFISKGLFQFENNLLVAIVLELNPETIDWFTVYTTLEKKYGSPLEINPDKAWWYDEKTQLALERPLTIKYLELDFFNSLVKEQIDNTTWRESARKEFLDEF